MATAPDYGIHPYPLAPEELPPTPRMAGLALEARWLRLGALVTLLLLPNLVLVGGLLTGDKFRTLKAHGQTATGEITDATVNSDRDGKYLDISYAYHVHGKTFSGHCEVASADARHYVRGQACSVTYLPSDPGTQCFGNPEDRLHQQDNWTLWTAAAIALFGAAWVLLQEFIFRRQLYLARWGEPTLAKITLLNEFKNYDDQRKYYSFGYAFTTPEGVNATGRMTLSKLIGDNLTLGTPLTVLFDPAAPHRHKPLCTFQNVRIVLRDPVGTF